MMQGGGTRPAKQPIPAIRTEPANACQVCGRRALADGANERGEASAQSANFIRVTVTVRQRRANENRAARNRSGYSLRLLTIYKDWIQAYITDAKIGRSNL